MAGQEPGHAVGRTVPGPEGEAAAGGPGHGRLDVGLDVPIDGGGLAQDGDDGAVPVQGDLLRHGGRRSYQGLPRRPPEPALYAHLVLVALCGGVGAARMLSGLVRVIDPGDITAVVNVGDDMVLHGLHISPDIDTVTYTLAGLDNRETGWGVTGETWNVLAELTSIGGEDWFALGDRDLATHLFRTGRLAAGEPLGAVTATLAAAARGGGAAPAR